MQDSEAYMWIGAGILALIVYTDIKKGVSSLADAAKNIGYTPRTQEQQINAIENAGGSTSAGSVGGPYMNIPGGVMKIPKLAELKRWQTGLIAVDRIVPGDWLTRFAYGVL